MLGGFGSSANQARTTLKAIPELIPSPSSAAEGAIYGDSGLDWVRPATSQVFQKTPRASQVRENRSGVIVRLMFYRKRLFPIPQDAFN